MSLQEDIYYDKKGMVALYGEFSVKLQKYVSEMQDNIAVLSGIVRELGTYWTDENYQSYKKGMQDGIRKTEDEVTSVSNLKKEIDKRKDETEIALEKMRVRFGWK